MSFKWKGRASFAEIAEAIGIKTDSVMAAMQDGDEWRVMYTDDEDTDNMSDDAPIWMVSVGREPDGRMRTRCAREQTATWGDLRRQIKRVDPDSPQ